MASRWYLFLLPLFFWTGKVKAEYYTISLQEVNVTITPEGYADFDELYVVHFTEPRHGIFRFIPYRDIVNGKNVVRIIEAIEVDGHPFSTSKENDNLVIKIGDPDKLVQDRQEYRIRYRVLNPFNFFEDGHCEFYWDLVGTKSPVEIGSINFHIRLPEQVYLTDKDVRFFTGKEKSTASDLEPTIFPKQVKGHTMRVFQPGEGLTVALNFPAGTFKAMEDSTYFLKRHGLLIPPFFFLIAGILAKWFSRNRRQTIMTEYFPPEGVSPAIAGGFVDNSVDNNDILCLIPHLANKGYLRLEVEKGGFLQKDNIIFYKLKEAGPELFDFEKQFLNGLFSHGDRVELKHLRDKFYTTMAVVKSTVKSWINGQGWYESDQKKFGCATALAGLISIAWGVYAVFVRQNLDGFALMGAGVILFIITATFHKRSPSGNETYRKFEGFRQFVSRAERPIIERLLKEDPLYYDKTMPYALAFGYLKKWNHQFEGLLTQPPNWYSGPMMYGTNSMQSWNTFSESFPSEISNIGSVFNSSPSSSGSGGGGGGFSGGGSGGGGTGSW